MANVRPSITEIYSRMRADASAALPGVDVQLPRTLFGVLLVAFVGSIHEAWGFLQRISDDSFADTAVDAAMTRHASIQGIDRTQAEKASGTADFGVHTFAPSVDIGRRLVRADGVEYVTLTVPVLTGGTNWVSAIEAVLAGVDGDYNGTARLVQTAPGVTDVTVITAGGVDGGEDPEVRAELLDHHRDPPQGGNTADYTRWPKEASANVSRVWPLQPATPGDATFDLLLADDSEDPPTVDGADVTLVQDYVDDIGLITAKPVAATAVFEPLDVNATLTPNTAEIQLAADAELDAMLQVNAAPDVTINLSDIQTALGRTPGLVSFVITSPLGDVSPVAPKAVIYRGTSVYV